MELASLEYQIAIWELFNLGRIGSSMVGIGSILAIWLSLRMAVNVRNNPETNIFAKIMSSLFGIIVLAATWMQWTIGAVYWTNTAGAFAMLKSNNIEISPAAESFIEYVGTTETATTPTPLGMAFIIVSGIIILGQIWMPKQN
tara:strand:- start:460 stop:888 length:429 start_codon:yes stop_codon:yes gene_type:complete